MFRAAGMGPSMIVLAQYRLAPACILAFFAVAPASAQQPAATEQPSAARQITRTTLTLCNRSPTPIDVAIAHMDAQTGSWMLSAWHKRAPGECKPFGPVRTGLFYYHAKSERGGVWPGDRDAERRYCVPNTAVKRDMRSQCGAGETTRPFKSRKMEAATYTFTFN
jgi:hypothetical protein